MGEARSLSAGLPKFPPEQDHAMDEANSERTRTMSSFSDQSTEAEEIRKIQAVVGAAGNVFSKDLRELRNQLRAMNDDIDRLKDCSRGVSTIEQKFDSPV